MTAERRHPSAELVERLFGAFGRGAAVVSELLADDVVWRVPGANRMAGEYRGRDAVIEFLRRTAALTNGTYRSELRWVLADDAHAVAVYRARGERDGRTIDIDQALFCSVRDGRLAEITAVPFDPIAFDRFWA